MVILGSAKTPTSSPPISPAKPWVYTTPIASSTLEKGRTFERKFHANQTNVEEMRPTQMAPTPFTQPALGVIATRPQSIPLIAPRNVAFFCLEKNMSITSQVRTPTAVATLVLSTALAASAPA